MISTLFANILYERIAYINGNLKQNSSGNNSQVFMQLYGNMQYTKVVAPFLAVKNLLAQSYLRFVLFY